MEASLKAQGVPWPITKPCPVSGTRAQPTHGLRFTTVPCQV